MDEKYKGSEGDKKKPLWMTIKKMGGEKWILLVLAGILLILAAIPAKKTTSDKEDMTQTLAEQDNDYALELEQKLKRILEQMDGVGTAEVMITLKSSEEKVIDKNVEESENSLTEQEVKEIKEIYPIIFEMYKIMDDSNKLKSLLNL